MDRRKTLQTMAKAALAVLLAWSGATQGVAQNKHNIVPLVDYEDGTNDWTANTGANCYVTGKNSSNAEYDSGNLYVNMITSQNSTPSAYKTVDFDTYEAGSGYTDETMTTQGYNIEFDFSMLGYGNYTQQLTIATVEGNSLPTNDNYTGSDYLFDMTLSETMETPYSFIPSYTQRTQTKWYVNGVREDVSLDNVNGKEDGEHWVWYHLKLVITDGSAAYTITTKSDGQVVTGGEDSKTWNPTGVVPTVKAIWTLISGGPSNQTSFLKFDNFEVYDYTEDESKRTAAAPAIAWKETDGTGKTYTISFKAGDVLHYTLPGQTETEVTSTSDGVTTTGSQSSIDVKATEGGKLSAYTTYYNSTTAATTTSTTQTVDDVCIYSVEIGRDSHLSSFSSAKAVQLFDDGVSIYITAESTSDGLQSEIKNLSLTIKKVTESTDVIPANAGVFLYKEVGSDEDNTVKLFGVEDESQLDANLDDLSEWYSGNNLLKATGEAEVNVPNRAEDDGVNYDYYCLRKNSATLAKVSYLVKIPAHKAYLKFPSTYFSSGANLSVTFEDDDATGIDGVKALGDGWNAEEGRVKNQGALYNLAGQRVDDAYKGIVVRNGRKYWNR